jgi:ATPase subunit of ABC transporter with duplicated ATPase domains
MALEVAGVPSLDKLLKYEWGLDKTMKRGLWNLKGELTSMHAFLGVVSGVPPVKLRAREITELSYAIEARLHSFVARIESTKGALVPAVSKRKIIHEMASYIKETQIKVKEVLQRYPCKSFLESISAQKVESNPVGIDGAVDELINKLSKGDHVSIVGMGGMGKTTLARAVYNKTKGDFDCGAFVPIGQRGEPDKVLKDIFHLLHIEIHGHAPDTRQLTNKLRNFLVDKRYILIDALLVV